MIRCDVFINLFFFEFWGCANLCTFPIISLFSRKIVVSKSSSSSGERKDFSFQLVVADTTTRALLVSFLHKQRWHFVRASHVRAKVESVDCIRYRFSLPLLVVFFEKCGLAREGVPLSLARGAGFSFSRDEEAKRRGLPFGRFTHSLSFARADAFSFFFLLFFPKQINCESTP